MNKIVAIFNSNPETLVIVSSWGIQQHLIMLADDNLEWDLSGFKLYEEDGETLIMDCSEYIYQWNIHTSSCNQVYLTDLETNTESDSNNAERNEIVAQLSNEELTECVADLMYEMSLVQLGMMGGE